MLLMVCLSYCSEPALYLFTPLAIAYDSMHDQHIHIIFSTDSLGSSEPLPLQGKSPSPYRATAIASRPSGVLFCRMEASMSSLVAATIVCGMALQTPRPGRRVKPLVNGTP